MFRAFFRKPRTVRVPIESSNVEVQQVRLSRQNRPLVSRFVWTFIVSAIVIEGVKYWDPLGTYAQRDVLQDELERAKRDAQKEHGEKYGKHWDKQHAQMKGTRNDVTPSETLAPGTTRMTIPVWIRKGPRRMYRESDPEWKEFAKLQGDSKRMEQIKRQIGETVMQQVSQQGIAKFELAVIKFNGKVGVALEMVPQIFTPFTYEMPCIWLTRTSVKSGWRPLPPQTGARIERVFRPVVLLEASSKAISTFFSMSYLITKAKVYEMFGQKPGGRKSVYVPPVPVRHQMPEGASPAGDSKSVKPVFPLFPNLDNSDTMRKMHADVVGSMPYSLAIQHASFAFNHVRNSRQKLAISNNVRGVCQVRGFITFFGERGKYRMEVVAYYIPAENVFIGAIHMGTKYLVQDFRAWERSIEKDRKQQEQEAGLSKKADAPDTPKSAVTTPSSSNSNGENKDTDKNK